MDYLETEQERLETHLSQGENIFIQKRDEGFGKYDLQLNNGSEANSYHDIGLDTPKVQVRFVESNILSVQNHSKFEKERSNSGASQYKRDNLKDSINLNSNAGQNESRILNKNEVSIQSNRDDKKESFICNTQRKYFSKGQNLNSPNQDKFRSNLTKRSEFRSEFQQATVTNQFDFANASEETENITKSQRQYMKKSNKQVQQKNSNKFSLIIKTQKAIRMFKSYLIPRKVHRKAFQFINDISSVDQSVNNQTVFTPFVIIDRFAQQKYDIENCIRVFKASIIQYRTQIFKFLDDNATVFDPLNKWRVIFDIILIIGVGFAVFFNTVEIFFSIDFTEIYPHGYPVIDWSLFMMFLLDVVFNLNTGVYKQGSISYERLDIFNNYYNGRMFKDLLSLLTFIRKGNSHFVTSFFNLFIFFKIDLVSQKLQQAQQIASSNQKYAKLYYGIQVIQLVLTIYFVAHCVAVIFYGQILFADYLNFDNEQNWMDSSNFLKMSDSWLKKYIFSLYFSITTMTTVGYGDITPKNGHEAIVVIISMIIACGVFAYSFNLIGSIISEMNRRQEEFKIKMKKVNTYLQNKSIEQDLKYKVLKFLEFKYTYENSLSKEEEESVLEGLSANLIYQINFQAKQKILSRGLEIFKFFSQQTKDELCMKLKEIRTNKEEVIFEQGSKIEDPEMYFIHEGSVEIYFKNWQTKNGKESILNVLKDGQFFGEMSFLTDKPRASNARAQESCILYSLKKSDFLSILSNDTQELEKYHLLYSKLIFSQSNQYISQACYFCSKESHTANQCPYIHYNPDKQLCILKNNFSRPIIERQKWKRSRDKSRAFEILQEIQELISLIKKRNKQIYQSDSTPQSLLGSPNNYNDYNYRRSIDLTNHKDLITSKINKNRFQNNKNFIIQEIRQMYNNHELQISSNSASQQSSSSSSSQSSRSNSKSRSRSPSSQQSSLNERDYINTPQLDRQSRSKHSKQSKSNRSSQSPKNGCSPSRFNKERLQKNLKKSFESNGEHKNIGQSYESFQKQQNQQSQKSLKNSSRQQSGDFKKSLERSQQKQQQEQQQLDLDVFGGKQRQSYQNYGKSLEIQNIADQDKIKSFDKIEQYMSNKSFEHQQIYYQNEVNNTQQNQGTTSQGIRDLKSQGMIKSFEINQMLQHSDKNNSIKKEARDSYDHTKIQQSQLETDKKIDNQDQKRSIDISQNLQIKSSQKSLEDNEVEEVSDSKKQQEENNNLMKQYFKKSFLSVQNQQSQDFSTSIKNKYFRKSFESNFKRNYSQNYLIDNSAPKQLTHNRNFSLNQKTPSLHHRTRSSNQSNVFSHYKELRFSHVETFISIPDELPIGIQITQTPDQPDQLLRQNTPMLQGYSNLTNSTRQILQDDESEQLEDLPVLVNLDKRHVQFNQKLRRKSTKEPNKLQHIPILDEQEEVQDKKQHKRNEKRYSTLKLKKENQATIENKSSEYEKFDKFKKRHVIMPLGRQSAKKNIGLIHEIVNSKRNSRHLQQSPLEFLLQKSDNHSIKEKQQQQEKENYHPIGFQVRHSNFMNTHIQQQQEVPQIQMLQRQESSQKHAHQSQKKQTLFQKQASLNPYDQNEEEGEQRIGDMLILDKMREYTHYFPSFNYKNIILLYNKLRTVQNLKLPPYFNVYSFYNRFDYKKINKSKPNTPAKKSIMIGQM